MKIPIPALSLLAIVVGLLPTTVMAWGDSGHQITCEIAWHYLKPATKREVLRFLPDGSYEQLSAACTWPDRYARSHRRFDWLKPYHFVNVDIRANSAAVTDENCENGECVSKGVEHFSCQLQDSSVRNSLRINATRLVGHFVGDIHQPLHVSHVDNCGGCSVKPVYDGADNRNMHSIWDTALIEKHLVDAYSVPDADSADLWESLAFDLRMSLTNRDISKWQSKLDPVAWANESLKIAKRRRLFKYRSGETLPDNYGENTLPVIKKRLKQGGVRLAAVLNAVFSDDLPYDCSAYQYRR